MSRLNCPHCKKWEHGEIYDARSRTLEPGVAAVYRRRRCRGCSRTYKTVEVVDSELLTLALKTLEDTIARQETSRRKEAADQQSKLRRKLQEVAVPRPTEIRTGTSAEGIYMSAVQRSGSSKEESL